MDNAGIVEPAECENCLSNSNRLNRTDADLLRSVEAERVLAGYRIVVLHICNWIGRERISRNDGRLILVILEKHFHRLHKHLARHVCDKREV